MQGNISQALNKYLVHCQTKGTAELTVENYSRRLSKFLKWLGEKEFCLESIDEYREYLFDKEALSTIHGELRVLKSFITYLYKRKFFNSNWGTDIEMPKLKRKVEFIPTQEQAIEIIEIGTETGWGDNALNRDRKLEARDALTFIVLTGLRQIEVQRLKVGDFDLKNNEFKVLSKGNNEDKLAFRRQLLGLIEKRSQSKKPTDKLFNVTKKHLNKCLERGCKQLEVEKITVHKLRKVFGTDLARKNINPFLIQRLLRHTNVQTTFDNYIKNNVEDLKLVLNSTGDVSCMSKTEVVHFIKSQLEARGLTNVAGLTISENTEQFVLTINKSL